VQAPSKIQTTKTSFLLSFALTVSAVLHAIPTRVFLPVLLLFVLSPITLQKFPLDCYKYALSNICFLPLYIILLIKNVPTSTQSNGLVVCSF
jgi:Na+-translocating ferredoxin:NAD+ oxidoreductase RnfE subunit